jgi:hypothetical protein
MLGKNGGSVNDIKEFQDEIVEPNPQRAIAAKIPNFAQ